MLSLGKQLATRVFSTRLFMMLVVCLASSAPAYEVTTAPSQSHDAIADFVGQLDGLETVLVDANAVETTKKEKQESAILLAARQASEKAAAEKAAAEKAANDAILASESRTTSAWATVVPTKTSGAGKESDAANPANAAALALTDRPSTSTLSLSDFGSKSRSSLLGDLRSGLGGTGSGKFPSASLGPIAAGVGPNGKDAAKKAPEKKEDTGSKVDPTGAMNLTKFGNMGDLTMGNIAKNNKQSDRDQSVKDMVDKALNNNKDKNKDKDEEKKKEEKAKVEKQIGELVEKDPFKFEDYEALRDLYNEQVKSNGDAAGEMFANNPKLDGLKEKIVNEFAPRDAAKPEVKDPLVTFLSDKDSGEKFQSPINVSDPNVHLPSTAADPNAHRSLESPRRSGVK